MINRWQIDKRVPIALVATMLIQVAAALIWATQLNARVDTLEVQAVSSADFGEKLARIDERVQAMKQDTDYIKRSLGKFIK